MSILSEETILESGKLFKENCQSRSLDTCAESSTQWFAYIKSHEKGELFYGKYIRRSSFFSFLTVF